LLDRNNDLGQELYEAINDYILSKDTFIQECLESPGVAEVVYYLTQELTRQGITVYRPIIDLSIDCVKVGAYTAMSILNARRLLDMESQEPGITKDGC